MIYGNIRYVWVNSKYGHVFTPEDKEPKYYGLRFKCLGYSYDSYFPFKLNTGRLFHKPSSEVLKKRKKERKEMRKRSSDSIQTK